MTGRSFSSESSGSAHMYNRPKKKTYDVSRLKLARDQQVVEIIK